MDAQEKEVIQKVQELVKTKFLGDYLAAFKHYDLDSNAKLGPKDLWGLLKDAGVGNWATREAWVQGIISELDKDHDGAVSIPEMMVAFAESVAFPSAK
jgi:Ca2+-binding EF-hand superfamily protein